MILASATDTQTVWIAISAGATALLALATLLFVVAAFMQLRTLKDTQADTNRSADGVLRAAQTAERALDLARQQNQSMQAQLTAAQEQNRVSQRGLDATVESASLARSLQALPLLSCRVSRGSGTAVELELRNVGATPALDADLVIVGIYDDDKLPWAEFVENEVEFERREDFREPRVNDEQFYGVSDRLYYFLVPPRNRVVASLYFPIEPETLHLLVQFRDVYGANYWQLYWFMGERDRFRLGGLAPASLIPGPRIVPDYEGWTLDTGDALPDELKEVEDAYRRSISVGYLTDGGTGWEDRGTWETI